jgi:hypothetical protein
MGNQFSPPLTVSHGREHPCYQPYQWQQKLAQRQIASLQQYYRQQREAKRRGAGTGYERHGSTPDSAWPLPGGKLIFP